MQLHYTKHEMADGYYGNRCDYSKIGCDRIYDSVMQYFDPDDKSFAALTVIGRRPRFFRGRRERHVAVLDCDSVANMCAAANWLKTEENLSYCAVESSPDKYWLVTDLVADYNAVDKLLKRTPGVDACFVALCNRLKFQPIRCLAKSDGHAPRFPRDHQLTGLAAEWYEAFKAHWDLPWVVSINKRTLYKYAIKSGTMMELVSDPDFDL